MPTAILSRCDFPASLDHTTLARRDVGDCRFAVICGYETGVVDKYVAAAVPFALQRTLLSFFFRLDALCATYRIPDAIVYTGNSHADAMEFFREASRQNRVRVSCCLDEAIVRRLPRYTTYTLIFECSGHLQPLA
jgi:hypothetical protein